MKKLFNSLASISVIAIALFLLTLAVILLPKILRRPISLSPNPLSTEIGYPPPEITQEITPTYEIPTVTFTIQPTVNLLTPVPPEGWPTDEPWPPLTSTPEPFTTPVVELFPTPQFTYLDEKAPDEELDSIWYPYRKGKNAKVELDEVRIDDTGKRKEFPKTKHDLNFGISSDYPRITSLHLSPDAKVIAYMEAEREGGVWKVIDISSGETLPEKKFSNNLIDFYGWSPNGKSFLAYFAENDPNKLTRSTPSLINVENGDRIDLQVPTSDGVPPSVYDMEFSSNGSNIADVVSYQPWSDKNNPYAVEIGIWENGDASSRKVLCRVENGMGAQQDSLKWSPDGKKLLWAGGLATPDQNEFINWLWIADISTGKCEPVIKMGINGPGIWVAGGFSADWSPDGNQIAFRVREDKEMENTLNQIMLLDVQSKEVREIIRSTENIFSNIRFSPLGDLVLYNVNGKEYGEIWAANLVSGEFFPVAGPTTLFAPFEWRKNQK